MLGRLLVDALTAEGFAVTHLTTAAHVLMASRSERFDLYLVNTRESHAIDGPDESLLGLLRELTPLAPVILLSANPWAAHTAADQLGVAKILSMPFDLDALLKAVQLGIA